MAEYNYQKMASPRENFKLKMAPPGENSGQKWPYQGKIQAKNGPAKEKFKPKMALSSKNQKHFSSEKSFLGGVFRTIIPEKR
jgi:hypothetical protein